MIMRGKYLLRGIRNLLLGALLVFGVTAFADTDANAQARFRGGFRGGGFHTRVFIGPRFGYPYRYWYGYPYGYAYGYYGQYVFGDSVAADSRGYPEGLEPAKRMRITGAASIRSDRTTSKTPASVTLHKHTGTDSSVDTTRDFAVKS